MPTNKKIAAQRVLHLVGEHVFDVAITVEIPLPDEVDYKCRYSIAWPDKVFNGYAMGVDSLQALLLALQKIQADILSAGPAKDGSLFWLEAGDGCGLRKVPE